MSIATGKLKNRPLVLCPPVLSDDSNWTFSKGLPVVLSAEVVALDCLELEMVNVWVWKAVTSEVTDPKTGEVEQQATGEWVKCSAVIKDLKADGDSAYKATLCFNEGKAEDDAEKLLGALDGEEGKRSAPAAFFEIRLKNPGGGPAAELWKDECFWNESWIFPVEVGEDGSNQFVRRGLGKSGEIPNWKFLGKYFKDKGYPPEADEIKKDESEKPLGSTSSSTQDKV
jgi:hypothetical protein